MITAASAIAARDALVQLLGGPHGRFRSDNIDIAPRPTSILHFRRHYRHQ